MLKYVSLLALSITLVGCGSDSSDVLDPIVDPEPTAPVSTLYAPVSGVYDATYDDGSVSSEELDKFVLVIDDKGVINSYNNLNDKAGGYKGCYSLTKENEVNFLFNGLELNYDDNTKQYTTVVGTDDVAWELNADGQVGYVIYAFMQSGNGINLSTNDSVIVMNTAKLDESVDSIVDNICE